jgi:hypothetical protein
MKQNRLYLMLIALAVIAAVGLTFTTHPPPQPIRDANVQYFNPYADEMPDSVYWDYLIDGARLLRNPDY